MTALIESARRVLGRRSDLDGRLEGLTTATEACRGRLPETLVEETARVVDRATTRLRLSAEHTVVALAGATGSGKSSTFNALTGLDLAAVGVRRPTTSWATACIWGPEGAGELLEWLGIPPRHQVVRDSMLDTARESNALNGLVLLDLPDHDSTEVSHHLEVERLVELTDLMVWVLDPQKYADAAIHDRFLRPLAHNKDVMLVVLNHIDDVPEPRRESLLADVRRLLDADGLTGVPLLATSARTGQGIAELRSAIAERVADKASTRRRIRTDLTSAAAALAAVSGDAPAPTLGSRERAELVDAVADAAGVPLVVEAVRTASTRRAQRATGWPVTAWLSRMRPDPLKRLHLDLSRGGKDLVAAARSSIPEADPIQKARVETAIRDIADSVSRPLTEPWSDAVRRASVASSADLRDRLDRAMTSTELGVGRLPWWCTPVRVLQWVLLLAAVGGLVWLGTLAAMGFLQVPQPTTPATPSPVAVPVPTVLLAGGAGLGILLALVSRVFIRVGARRRARKAERRLRAAVATVTEELVLAPVEAELAAYERAREGLRRAGG